MRIHILGICGTFMAGIAQIAQESGFVVTGSDENVYPPMSTQLTNQGISLMQGYDPTHIDDTIDCVIVGNVIRRGNPAMEYVLDQGIPYTSGPQWLFEHVLKDRWVLAVSGTHGKTTTTSMLTWILEQAGLHPGFLIGGVPGNFGQSARLGQKPFFVIEADEYDSAFFDKRSKFIHYRPKAVVLSNVEFDHADIFPDLSAIEQQFHYLIRTVPSSGLIIHHANDHNIDAVLARGCWSPTVSFAGEEGWGQAQLIEPDGSHFKIDVNHHAVGEVKWNLIGQHNVNNALAALLASSHAGVPLEAGILALHSFKNVKRRLEIIGQVKGVTVYDDFAHHPTAIALTLAGLRAKIGKARMITILEFASFTMRTGVHQHAIQDALALSDKIIIKRPIGLNWDLLTVVKDFSQPTDIYDNVDAIIENVLPELQAGDHVIVMSNSGFGGIHQKLLKALESYDKTTC